ncbi:MAG: glycoside hydrolase family 2 protein [Treponema sp.]|nr:glycoside hydrolase family 2 protein [Treponema sp.]
MKKREKLSLCGEWKLIGKKDDKKIELPLSIPGDFHTALIQNKIIKDPFYAFNEEEQLWVGKNDWTIKRNFSYKAIPGTKAILELTEADTFFTIFINGQKTGTGKNQFARYRFDVSDFLKEGDNSIEILFESAEKKSEEISKSLPYPVPCMKYDVFSPNRNLARKCQCHGGWDWGPCIMVSGIYGDIFIENVADGISDSFNFKTDFINKNDAKVLVEYSYQAFEACQKDFTFTISGKDIKKETITVKQNLKQGLNLIKAELLVKNPQSWKTQGELKEVNLRENTPYKITAAYKDSKTGDIIEEKDLYFTTLKAISIKENSDNPGRSLYFENNGRRIFAKGSNWIPADALPSRMTDERYDDLLKSAALANQNCIRVWGGGIYEKDHFYDLCDKLGLIVWQDCMFACSTYPATDDFFAEVENELNYQIPRLKSHACIGIWCGNNENFGALNWFKESNQNRDRYIIDYDRLYNGLIGKKIKQLDPSRLYWPSSPCSGPDDFADNWHSDNMGDMHYWSVWHERKSFDAYLSINPRFVSEFGYESFPSLDCIKSFAEEKDFNFTSRVMEYHQRSPSGNSIMIENFSRYFKFPQGFENMVYLSQVQQAVAIKTAVDWWRSLNPHCMGSLIWQLNDVWPGPSWSSLEYSGKWKLLHYESKKFFENVYMPLFVKDGKINAVICNETAESLEVKAEFRFMNFDGSKYAETITKNINVDADQTKNFLCIDIDFTDSNFKNNYSQDGFFVYASMKAFSKSGKEYSCTNTLWSDVYKHCNIKKASIQTEIKEISEIDNNSTHLIKSDSNSKFASTFEITLTSNEAAFFVSLDTIDVDGIFSDNMITLLPGEAAKITFFSKKELSPEKLKKALKVYDLSNI